MAWNAVEVASPNGACGFSFYRTDDETEGYAVGAAPQWGDNNTGTYAYIKARWGTGTTDRWVQARATLPAPPTSLVPDGTERIAVWYKQEGNPDRPPVVRLSTGPGTNYMATATGTSAGDLPEPGGWTVRELDPSPWGLTVKKVLEDWATYGLYVEVMTDVSTPPEPVGVAYQEHTIREVRFVVYYDVPLGVPCRLFPREDGLGVGGGRIFPPPRSQQRSLRRFGYY